MSLHWFLMGIHTERPTRNGSSLDAAAICGQQSPNLCDHLTIWGLNDFNKWQLTSTCYLNPTWVTITLDHLKLIIIKKHLHPRKLTAGYPKWWVGKETPLKMASVVLVSMLDFWGLNISTIATWAAEQCSKPWSSFIITVGSWRDPFIGLWNNPPKNWVVFHPPIFHPTNQGEMITTHLLLEGLKKGWQLSRRISKLSVFFSCTSRARFLHNFFNNKRTYFLVWVD